MFLMMPAVVDDKDKDKTTKCSPAAANARALFALVLIASLPTASGRLLPRKQEVLQDMLGRNKSDSSLTTTRRNLGAEYPRYCVGYSRDDGNDYKLERNEAICDEDDDDIRFGLNEDGYLGLWSDFCDTVWFPGKRGDRLVLQSGDSNLVLYSGSRAAWASDCKRRDGAKGKEYFIEDGAVTVKDSKNKVVWELDDNGNDSQCYPSGGGGGGGNRDPPKYCLGEDREAGNDDKLQKNQAICDSYDDDIRFGLNSRGYLGLWDGNRALWFPDKKGDRLVLQSGDANLVLYDGNKDTWASDCRARSGADGGSFSISYGQVTVFDDNYDIVWELDGGSESDCYPYLWEGY